MGNHFDYIIVGAGAAGCVLANRLSANPANRVCLLESGGKNHSPLISIPAGIFGLYGHKRYDYTYAGVPQKHLDNRPITVNRGRGLGGSSAINSMVYIRGNRNDYDRWAELGCTGWSYDEVLPVFKQLERNLAGQSNRYHGFGGELPVAKPQAEQALARQFVSAARHVGLPENPDFNAASQLGLGIYQVTQYQGQRASSYTSFVKPVMGRPNLTVLTGCDVSSLIMRGNRADGVNADYQGRQIQLHSNREVIVSAGAIASPRILLASGIGDRNELEALGLDCHVDLPGVGKNLQDHIDSMVTVRSGKTVGIGISLATLFPHILPAPLKYYLQRKGWWTTNYVEAGGFAYSTGTGQTDDDPDIQFHFTPIYRSHRGKRLELGHGYSLFTCVLRPYSTGSVSLVNDGTYKNVLIDHNFLSDERDCQVLVGAVKKARQILGSPAFDDIRGVEMAPGPEVQTDGEILDYLRRTATTVYHPVGTCKMGTDDMSVVNPGSLKVYGVDKLRVADASIMPRLISGNTSAPSMMIAAKAAGMILDTQTD